MPFRFVFLFSFLTAMLAFAQDSTLVQAQKLYAQGRYAEAALAFGGQNPLEAARAYLQIADTAQVNQAARLLDSLLMRMEPEDSLYAHALLLRTGASIRQGNFAQAARTWRQASDFSRQGLALETVQLCEDISAQSAELSQTACDAVQNRDRELLPSPMPKHAQLKPVQAKPAAAAPPAAAPVAAKPAPQTSAPKASAPTASAPAPKASTGKYVLRLGVFGVKVNAEGLIQKYSGKVPLALAPRADGKFAVVTGAFRSKEEALLFGEQTLKPLGQDFIAVPE
jgi:hypothetical protein